MKDEKTKLLDKFIVEIICVDLLPFSIVTNTKFSRLILILNSRYKLKLRHFYTSKIPLLYKSLPKKIKNVIKKV